MPLLSSEENTVASESPEAFTEAKTSTLPAKPTSAKTVLENLKAAAATLPGAKTGSAPTDKQATGKQSTLAKPAAPRRKSDQTARIKVIADSKVVANWARFEQLFKAVPPNQNQTNSSLPALTTTAVNSPVKAKGKKRKKPLPPGQRLIRALAVALALVGGQEILQPLLGPCESTARGATHAVPLAPPFAMNSELADIKQQVEDACQIKKLTPGMFAVDPKSGAYVEYNGSRQFPAASMIKVPVLVALFTAIDRGDVDAKTILTIRQDLVGGGSGHLQYRPVGTKLPLSTVSELMIIISDNTATNMIIDLCGGKDVVNKKFTSWGLKHTSISNWLPDLTGTNKTSPYDLVYLLARVDKGEILSPASRARMFEIMSHTKTRTLINPSLPPGVKLAHKTGDIGGMVGDTGVITAANGAKLYVAFQVERPHNDRRANELIRKLAGITYNGFSHEPGFDAVKTDIAKDGAVEVFKTPARVSNVGGRVKGTDMLITNPRVPSESYSEALELAKPAP